jgi:hypothetical protein
MQPDPAHAPATLTDEAVEQLWGRLMARLQTEWDKHNINTEALLLLIGLREMGWGPRQLSKEEKFNLIHVGMCTVLAPAGYYQLERHDDEGWPHYALAKPLPQMDVFAQALFLRRHLVQYFTAVFPDL